MAGSAALVVVGVLLLATLVPRLCADEETRRRIGRWTAWSFAGHLGLGLAVSSSSTLQSYLGGDADQYHQGAQGIVAHWLDGSALPLLPPGKEGFYYLMAGLYWAVGASPVTGLVINAVMTAALVPIMSTLTTELFGERAARPVPVLVTLLPGFALWPSQLLREAGVYFFTAVALLAAARLARRVKPSSVVVLASSLALLSTWRSYIALMVAGGVAVALVVGSRGLKGIAAGLSATVVVGALVVGLGLGYSGLRAANDADLVEVDSIRLDSATGADSGYLEDADVSDSRRAVSYLPVALPYLAFGPFPWQLAGGRQLFGVPDAVTWWILLPSLATGIHLGWRRHRWRIAMLIGPALGSSVAIALLVANFGTMVRARMQVILILVPLVAFGWSERHVALAPKAELSERTG
ncbi:MAG: hypothetical protein WKF43_15425 [Acidimicrobiales bacterium]